MERVLTWWKREKRYMVLLKACLVALLPLVCCLVHCAMDGMSIGQAYLPGAPWNDELFYFKQVEAMVEYGYPRGYYGFNESHALKLSYAAWSPVLVFPWIIWGKLFGWTYFSPFVCNIVLLSLACFLFVWLVKPTWKQVGVLSFLFALFPLFVRYMLSGMPEIICMSMLIIFYGVCINYLERERGYKLAVMLVLAGLLVLMRPYMLLFLLLPMGLWIRRSGRRGVIGSGLVLAAVLGLYWAIKHFLGAEYFAPLFFTDWITTFFTEGLVSGIRNFFGTLYYMGKDFLAFTIQGFKTGWTAGAFFGGYLLLMGIFIGQSLRNWRRKEQKQLIINGHLAISFVGMLFALLLMYKLIEGSKHLLTFMAVGIFLVSLMDTRFYRKMVLVGVVFAYLYTYQAVDPYDYQVPYVTEQQEEQLAYWQEILEEKLVLDEAKVPSFDNVVIWDFQSKPVADEKQQPVVDDKTPQTGGYVNLKWQLLYALPTGTGISCCRPDYVREQLEHMESRYIATLSGGETDVRCRELGYEELARDEDMVVYRRY